MENTSNASSDSNNAFLSPKSNGGCSATTQTPEIPQHEIKLSQDNAKKDQPSEANNVNPTITVFKLDTQKPLSELEQDAKSLAIPEVVVEYIKDSFNRQDIELGTTNPAFEPQELIVLRTSSSVSLRDGASNENSLAIGKANPQLYYSLPRPGDKTLNGASDNAISQNTNPKMSVHLGVGDSSMYASSSSLGYPRSIPPSPNFGYKPMESESSAVYTIIAPIKYKINESENERTNELKLLNELRAQLEEEKKLKRKFEFSPVPVEVERRRHRLQCCTDVCSTMFLIPGILIAVVTPISLIPMFMLPLTYYISLITIFLVSGIIAILSLAMSGLIGNIVWHYDPNKMRLRPRLHCGKGPLLHFWGNGFYPDKDDKKPLYAEKNV